MADLTGMLQAAAGVSTGNPNAWDISKAYYDAGADAGDVSKSAVLSGPVLSPTVPVGTGNGLKFSTDGTKFYVVDGTNDVVYQFSAGSAWNVNGFVYDSKSFSVASQATVPRDLAFKSDGTKMYVIDDTTASVYQYSLSTAWDISTASYDSVTFSIVTEETTPTGLFFKPDGTKMYVLGNAGDDVNEYDLSTAWDISSASYVQNFSVSPQDTLPNKVSFLGDGTKMYVLGNVGEDINQYDLSTPWDISTASYVQNFSISSQGNKFDGFVMKPDGVQFFVLTTLSNANTAVSFLYPFVIGGFSVAAEETAPTGVSFKPDGIKMYVIGTTGDDVNEYDLSTAWDITTASYLQNFSVAAQDIGPSGIVFKDDGLKMYFAGDVSDAIHEYSLSVAWDISSASYVQSFGVASQETQPRGPAFKTDGTKMYVVGPTTDTVYQYSLSTAWDISSASYDSVSFSVGAQDTVPQDLKFKPDGTKMYILGSTNDQVYEYDLSNPWDVSSASYVQTAPTFENTPRGIYWRDNGEEFFVVGSGQDRVFKFSISPT